MTFRIYRYALGHGAAALAVDVEEVEHLNEQPRSDLSSLKLSQRSLQRRSGAGFLDEGSEASSTGVLLVVFHVISGHNYFNSSRYSFLNCYNKTDIWVRVA